MEDRELLKIGTTYRLRQQCAESQAVFWSRFGVTQSVGARYESGQVVPTSVAILIALWASGKVRDEDLDAARQAAGRTRTPMKCHEIWAPLLA